MSNVKNLRNGDVVINCETNDCLNRLYQIAAQLGDRYDIHIPAVRKPKFKIFDVSERYSEQELIDVIKNQNETLKDSEIEVMKIYENKQFKNFGAIVELDDESVNNI